MDVGNGEVLYKSDGTEFGSMMFGHRGYGGFGQGKHFGGWAMNHQGMGAATWATLQFFPRTFYNAVKECMA